MTKNFILRCDASDLAVAAELVQIQEGTEVPICFISRILRGSELRYSVGEKEMLAIVFATQKLNYWLRGNEFIVETDHRALTFLKNNRYMNNRIYRWSLLLQEFAFEIRYRPGKSNVTADILSRKDCTREENPNEILVALNQMQDETGIYSLEAIMESQELLTDVREHLGQGESYKGYFNKDGVIVKQIQEQELYALEEGLAKRILKDLHHKYGHIGSRKTWMIYRENFYSKNDLSRTKEIIGKCQTCILGKYKNFKNRNTVESICVKEPLEIIAIDYLSNLIRTERGNKHILVIYDLFTKFVKYYPTKRCNKRVTIKLLEEYMHKYGRPKKILSDNATYFNNETYKQHWEKKKIQAIFTSIRRPNANPSERQIEECLKYLRLSVKENHRQWDLHLEEVENHINNTPHTTTEISPVSLMMRKLPPRPWAATETKYAEILNQAKLKLEKRAKKYKEKENRRIRKHVRFKEGDLVIIKRLRVSNEAKDQCAKLMLPYQGPYRVKKVIGQNTYELGDENTGLTRGKFHIEMIFPYKEGDTANP